MCQHQTQQFGPGLYFGDPIVGSQGKPMTRAPADRHEYPWPSQSASCFRQYSYGYENGPKACTIHSARTGCPFSSGSSRFTTKDPDNMVEPGEYR